MRTSLLSLIAAASLCCGTALVAVQGPAAQAAPGLFPACATAEQTNCVESATANGVPTSAGSNGAVRDFPFVRPSAAAPNGLEFGVLRDTTGNGTVTGTTVDPDVTYALVVRFSDLYLGELYGTVRDARFAVESEYLEVKTLRLSFRPTPVNFRVPGTCVVGRCGTSTTRANQGRVGYARGFLTPSTGIADGIGADESRGFVHVANAQAQRVRINFVNHTFVTEVANPRLTPSGAKAPGYVEVLLPHFFAELRFEMPDAKTATGSRFEVTRVVGKKNVAVPFTLTQEPKGIRVRITGAVFPTSTYRIHPKVSPPAMPRNVQVWSDDPPLVKVAFYTPFATGGSPITGYQSRCKVLGTDAWHYSTPASRGSRVTGLPKAAVEAKAITCQARSRNKIGYSAFTAPVLM